MHFRKAMPTWLSLAVGLVMQPVQNICCDMILPSP